MKTEKQIKGRRSRLLADLKQLRQNHESAKARGAGNVYYERADAKLSGQIDELNWILK